MALITTVGGSTSDSYASIAEADLYFAASSHVLSATWLALSTNQKETALRTAARQLNLLNYYGCAVTTTQALKFPRTYKTAFTSTAIPQQIKYAQMEQALYVAQNATSGGESKRDKLQAEGVKSFSLGDLSEDYSDSATANQTVAPKPISLISRSALQFLAGLIKSTARDQNRLYLPYPDLSNQSYPCEC